MPTMVLASVVLALTVQAQAAPPMPASARPLPGIAQPRGGTRVPGPISLRVDPGEQTYRRELRDARREVDRRRRAGEISGREARQLRREIALVGRIADRYDRDGLSDSERREIDTRAQVLRSQTAVRGTL